MQNEISNDAVPTESSAPVESAEVTSSEATVSADDGASKESLLDHVLQSIGDKDKAEEGDKSADNEEDSPSSDEPDEKGQDEEEQQEEEPEEATEEEALAAKEGSKKAQREVRKLLKQRKELRGEIETLRPTAEIGQQLNSFAIQHDLGADDIINALHIAATIKRRDWGTAYEMLSPYVRHMQEYLGHALPQDLEQMVQQQQMTEQAAKEMAKLRYDNQYAQIEQQRMNDLSRQYFTNHVQGNVASAVSSYEAQLEARDPDYKAKKAPLVKDRAFAILQSEFGGKVASEADALQIVKRAYEETNQYFRKLAPRPKATAPTPTGTSVQTHGSRPAPNSIREAIESAFYSSQRR